MFSNRAQKWQVPLNVLSVSIQQLLIIMPLTMAVPGLLGSIIGLNTMEIMRITQVTIMLSGIMTLLHSYRGWKFKAHTPMVIGADLSILAIGIKYATAIKLGVLFSTLLVGGILMLLLAKTAKFWMKYISETVIFATLSLYSISFLPIVYDWFLGGASSPDYGSNRNFLIGAAVLAFTLFIHQYGRGYLKRASVGLGILFGFTISLPIGLVNWQFSPMEVPFRVPSLLPYMPAFEGSTFGIAMPVIMMLILKQLMDLLMFVKLKNLNAEAALEAVQSGMKTNAVGTLIGFLLGAAPVSTSVQNYGFEVFTGFQDRGAMILTGLILTAMGFSPSLASMTTAIPFPVIGAVGILLIAQLFGKHFYFYSLQKQTQKSMLVMSLSMAMGFLTIIRPDFAYEFRTFGPLMSSGIFICFASGLFLELVIPEN